MTSPQRRRLMQLWNQRWAKHGGSGGGAEAEASRDARMMWLTAVLGCPVRSSKELSGEQARAAIAALERELGVPVANRPDNIRSKNNIVNFPNRGLVTKRQIWKIRQLVRRLGWDEPARLAGFLRAKCQGAERMDDLSFRQGWRVIEALFATAARARVKARRGQEYKVGAAELDAEVSRLKAEWGQAAEDEAAGLAASVREDRIVAGGTIMGRG